MSPFLLVKGRTNEFSLRMQGQRFHHHVLTKYSGTYYDPTFNTASTWVPAADCFAPDCEKLHGPEGWGLTEVSVDDFGCN